MSHLVFDFFKGAVGSLGPHKWATFSAFHNWGHIGTKNSNELSVECG